MASTRRPRAVGLRPERRRLRRTRGARANGQCRSHWPCSGQWRSDAGVLPLALSRCTPASQGTRLYARPLSEVEHQGTGGPVLRLFRSQSDRRAWIVLADIAPSDGLRLPLEIRISRMAVGGLPARTTGSDVPLNRERRPGARGQCRGFREPGWERSAAGGPGLARLRPA